MTVVFDGGFVRPVGITAYVHDDGTQANISNTSYDPGSPEVGVFFVAPASGRVRLTVGGGFRDNGASNQERTFLSPQLFEVTPAGRIEVLAPSVTFRGYSGLAENREYQYGCRVSLIEGLTAGRLYYIRLMHLTDGGTDPDSADITARDLIVVPVP
jgi:hypothetical protein